MDFYPQTFGFVKPDYTKTFAIVPYDAQPEDEGVTLIRFSDKAEVLYEDLPEGYRLSRIELWQEEGQESIHGKEAALANIDTLVKK